MEFDDNTFDGGYALESTLYARNPEHVYREILRVLKPGAIFVDSAWAMTDTFNPYNAEHVKIEEAIEVISWSKSNNINCCWSKARSHTVDILLPMQREISEAA